MLFELKKFSGGQLSSRSYKWMLDSETDNAKDVAIIIGKHHSTGSHAHDEKYFFFVSSFTDIN